jgi:hypothetical protein
MPSSAQLRLVSLALLVFFGALHEASAAGHATSRTAQVTLIARMPDDVTMLLPGAVVGSSVSSATPHAALQFDFVGHLLPGANVTAACRAESGRIVMRSPQRDSLSRLLAPEEFACDGRFRSLPSRPREAALKLILRGVPIRNRVVAGRLDITLSVI